MMLLALLRSRFKPGAPSCPGLKRAKQKTGSFREQKQNRNKRLRLLWAVLCLLPAWAWGQQQFQLSDYLASQPGDTLQLRYGLPGRLAGQPMLLAFDTAGSGQIQRLLNGLPSQVFALDSLRGWALYAIGQEKGSMLKLDEPLKMAPALVGKGQSYTAQGTFVLYENGRRAGAGQIAARVQVQGHDSSATHLHNFGDCLVLTTTVEWQLPSGMLAGYEFKEWYARDTGLVKVAGQEFRKDKAGRVSSAERLAAMLEKAFVGGAWLE
jgi:hypothetical protein